MDYLAYPLGDLITWTFDNLLVPVGELGINPNVIFLLMGFAGMFLWLKMQSKYNKEAETNADQIK